MKYCELGHRMAVRWELRMMQVICSGPWHFLLSRFDFNEVPSNSSSSSVFLVFKNRAVHGIYLINGFENLWMFNEMKNIPLVLSLIIRILVNAFNCDSSGFVLRFFKKDYNWRESHLKTVKQQQCLEWFCYVSRLATYRTEFWPNIRKRTTRKLSI